MKIFEFNRNVIDKVVDVLHEAERFIRIAIFQLHNRNIFSLLNEKLDEGVSVEVFTLPYDSINENVRDDVTGRFMDLEKNGATLYFCRWNVGDPERTSTAVGRWYSFHGKFIVTDKSAISLSANLTQNEELDALIIFKDDSEKVDEFNKKFDELVELYIKDFSGYNGTIRQRIIDTGLPDILSVFDLPPGIQTVTHKEHWIKHYPSSLCPIDVPIEDRIYLTPFDCRGRDFLMNLISDASEYTYLSTESFTDTVFTNFLVKVKLKGLDMRILSGAYSMDFTDRVQNTFRELLANEIKIRTIDDIHAKLIITDKYLAVNSANLNKMNLGFDKTRKYWRENTESISIISDIDIVSNAKHQFLDIYNNSIDIENVLAKKVEIIIGSTFKRIFGLRSRSEVKKLFARLVVRNEIQVKKLVLDICKITSRLMQHFNRNLVEKNDFFLALILYYLSERKHNFDELKEKLNILNIEINTHALLLTLINDGFIEKIEDFYKIKLEKLFR